MHAQARSMASPTASFAYDCRTTKKCAQSAQCECGKAGSWATARFGSPRGSLGSRTYARTEDRPTPRRGPCTRSTWLRLKRPARRRPRLRRLCRRRPRRVRADAPREAAAARVVARLRRLRLRRLRLRRLPHLHLRRCHLRQQRVLAPPPRLRAPPRRLRAPWRPRALPRHALLRREPPESSRLPTARTGSLRADAPRAADATGALGVGTTGETRPRRSAAPARRSCTPRKWPASSSTRRGRCRDAAGSNSSTPQDPCLADLCDAKGFNSSEATCLCYV